MTDPKHPEGTNTADAIANLEVMLIIAEQAGKYFASLCKHGVPKDSASRMTETYHEMLITMAKKGAGL